MQQKHKNTDFTRFLKDEKFIEWKLFPTDELNLYWQDFLNKYPENRINFQLAEKHFRNVDISSYKILPEKKKQTLQKLEQSIRTYHRRRKIRTIIYTAAACAAALVLAIAYIQINKPEKTETFASSPNHIIGSKLESKEIQLISGNNTTSFQENIHVEVNNTGMLQVETESSKKEIAIAQNSLNKLIVPYGKQSKVILSDGTTVWLNSGSALEFPTQFEGEIREIRLASGEMYIEVAPDKQKPFFVRTAGFSVRVYGTKFNISAYTDSPQSVVLVEGRIGLQSATKQETILSSSEQAVYFNNGTFNKQKVDVSQFISWKDGYLEFDDTPIQDVLKQIGRYYNISFNYDKEALLKEYTCTGKVILSDNLDNVMTTLTLISSTTYRKENKLIYITINLNKTSMPMEK